MNWLVFVFALECGMLPNTSFIMYQPNPEYVMNEIGFYTDLSASVEVKGFYIGGGMHNYFWKTIKGISFWPYQMTFLFNAGWRNDYVDVGFRHYCMHPVIPYAGLVKPQQNWEGGYQELFIKFKGRLTLIK